MYYHELRPRRNYYNKLVNDRLLTQCDVIKLRATILNNNNKIKYIINLINRKITIIEEISIDHYILCACVVAQFLISLYPLPHHFSRCVLHQHRFRSFSVFFFALDIALYNYLCESFYYFFSPLMFEIIHHLCFFFIGQRGRLPEE